MALSILTPTQVTAGTKQFGYNPPRWYGYQTKGSIIPFEFFFNNSTAYPITAVATGALSNQTANEPVIGDLFNTIYTPNNTESERPLVSRQSNYYKVTAAANNDGMKISVGTIDVSSCNWVAIVAKSGQTSTAGKLKIRSSSGNESVCAFTTSATANTWLGGAGANALVFPFQDSSVTAVTFTGTPVFTGITEIEVTVDSSADDVSVYEVYFMEDYKQSIGYVNTITFGCLAGYSEEESLEQSTLLCNQLAEMQIGTGREVSRTFTVKKQALSMLALINGDVVKTQTKRVPKEYSSAARNPLTIASGAVTLASASVTVSNVYLTIGGVEQELTRYHTATDIPEGFYHQNGATVTFNTAYNGKVPKITVFEDITVAAHSIRGLELGYVGSMYLPRRTESGRVVYDIANKAQLIQESTSAADNGDEVEVKVMFMADADGVFYTKALE